MNDYTGLDISPTAKRFFHKRFVHGSATLMPLNTNEFDGVWTIWVMEHVPNPQAALIEMRRVTKDGGYIFPGAAVGLHAVGRGRYPVRPFSDFGLSGKLTKASIPIQSSLLCLARPFVRGAVRALESYRRSDSVALPAAHAELYPLLDGRQRRGQPARPI